MACGCVWVCVGVCVRMVDGCVGFIHHSFITVSLSWFLNGVKYIWEFRCFSCSLFLGKTATAVFRWCWQDDNDRIRAQKKHWNWCHIVGCLYNYSWKPLISWKSTWIFSTGNPGILPGLLDVSWCYGVCCDWYNATMNVDAIFPVTLQRYCNVTGQIALIVLKYVPKISTGNSWKSTGILFSWFIRHPEYCCYFSVAVMGPQHTH